MQAHARCLLTFALLLITASAWAQTTDDPLPPIDDREPVVVDVAEFATLPMVDGQTPRMMNLVDELATGRMFVNGMRGPIWAVSYEGEVGEYINIADPQWEVNVASGGREQGFQNFAFHPQYGRPGTPGYGRFYTWTDVEADGSPVDFTTPQEGASHHTVLLEWVDSNPGNDTYDGEAPRELMRFAQPFGNHNAGGLAFNPLAEEGDPDFGNLYVGVADGGAGGDPMDLSQDLASGFGKLFRIDPRGSDSRNGAYGIPDDNPLVDQSGALNEIYAYGMRNPQRFGWDPATGRLYLADIGQNTVEEVSLVPRGGNLGWNDWEGSFRYVGREGVSISGVRGNPDITYPVAEYSHREPLLGGRAAVTGVVVYRNGEIPQLRDRLIFADFPSGEIFLIDADNLPEGGSEGITRMLLRDGGGQSLTFLELIQQKNEEQGRNPARRTDLRMNRGPDNRVFLLNKHDATIRVLVPER
ncbi:MAG: PQQ-dependent sugar dehydrogenase [Balneolaceae bacterium]|nr:PQQ-dependent sugar dehydrogenase [Balneolaceae bacterium]